MPVPRCVIDDVAVDLRIGPTRTEQVAAELQVIGSRGEVGYDIVPEPAIEHEHVRAAAAGERVVPGSTDQAVVARPAVQRIVAGAAVEAIIAGAAAQIAVAGPTPQKVVS